MPEFKSVGGKWVPIEKIKAQEKRPKENYRQWRIHWGFGG